MEFIFLAAIGVAKGAHNGQLRKYTHEPYLSHPFAVAGLVASVTDDDAMIVAAILHDVVEDSAIKIESITGIFGIKISKMVEGMTDVSKPGDGNRKARKAIDRQHIANSSAQVKTIKLADLIDNTKSIIQFDPKFAKVYMAEKRLLLGVLSEGDATLLELASDLVENYYSAMQKNTVLSEEKCRVT